MPALPSGHEALRRALLRRLAWLQRLDAPERCAGDVRRWRERLRRWQSGRLRASFGDLLASERTRPAAEFFLEDLYGDRDFSARDRDLARLLPLMARLLPSRLLRAAVHTVELAALSHAFDLRLAAWLARHAQGGLDLERYARAYRAAGCPRLRAHQIDLVVAVGEDIDWAVHRHGVERLLRLSRGPARLAGLETLQTFLERGFSAFKALDGARPFLARIASQEREVSRRLFAGHPHPLPPFDGAAS